jgi:hypothetical protein
MKKTTRKLLTLLGTTNKNILLVEVAKSLFDPDVIHLDRGYELIIDEDAALPTVSFDERMDMGGNVNIAAWVIDEDAVFNEVIETVLKI